MNCKVRILLLISVLFVSVAVWGLGYTPTDGGLVVNLKQGDHILLSTWVDKNGNGVEEDGEEFFVCHYPGYTEGSYFGYTNWDKDAKGNFLKLIPQDAEATEPSSVSIWSIDTALTRIKDDNNYALGGISYTMWSSNSPSYTLLTSSDNNWKYQGDLTNNKNNANACDVIFVAPTNRSTVTSFDPKKTLTTYCRRTDQDSEGRFNGKKGFGFLGLPYREVYMMVIPRFNEPIVYGNAALVGFNTDITKPNYTYHQCGNAAQKGQALFAYNDRPGEGEKYVKTKRTIFRLYILDDPLVSSCPDSYFFAYDEQDCKGYRMGPGNKKDNVGKTMTDSTDAKKIYTIDRLVCMDSLPGTKYYVSDYMFVPIPDSTYYYVGYKNKYCHTDQGDAFNSQFKNIDTLKLQHMDKPAPRGAFGRMIVDTTQTSKQNLGVEFRPAGVFLRVDAGEGRYRNIEMHPEEGDTSWICNEMWTITDAYTALTIKATLYSGTEFSEEDPGSDIPGWSEYVEGNTVPLADDPSKTVTGDMTGWARVYTNKSTTNGGLEFVRAEKDKYVRYDNNGHFGATIPNTHAKAGETRVVLSEPRLLEGYNFRGWYTKKDTTAGDGTWYKPGVVVNLSAFDGDSLILYAQAKYTGGISVALSFIHPTDGKRYFLTHPNTSAPRYAKARHFNDWTDTYQGMSDADNTDSCYLSTYLIIGNNTVCKECADGEYVLDPRREMVHGAVDSLMFYEHFAPDVEEYIGLYYVAGEFNKILANNTWAGLFKSTKGWPDPMSPCIDSTKLFTTHYLDRDGEGKIRKNNFPNECGDTVYYNPSTGYFDGAKSPVTNFTISGVGVVDEHYVVLPDTTEGLEWTDTITFGIHHDERIENPVWSKLIGKQLMLQMMVGDKITYFHPNDDKIITEYTQLRLNGNYRLDETFEYIRDARVESLGTVSDEDKPHINDRLEKNYFGRLVTSGLNTPVDVLYEGNYIDIIDTIRITLRPLGPNKIKAYYGRWKEGAPGLHIRPDGSRYRDIIVRTKTVHYSEPEERLVLSPVMPVYRFSPLKDAEKVLSFTLAKERFRQLLDTKGNVLAEEILSSVDHTSALHITTSQCTFKSTGSETSSYFNKDGEKILNAQVALITKANNESGPNHDTLLVNTSVTIDAVTDPVSCQVPLVQTTLESEELVWSAVVNGQRYFIMAGEDGERNKSLIFRQYEQKGNTLYKKEDGKTQLVKGSANPANSDTKYITLWRYAYVNQGMKQITLEIDDPVGLKFIITGSTPGVLANSDPRTAATLTYDYVNVYVNDNENFEEQVKLSYGADKWLKLNVTAGVPSLTLVNSKDSATVFSFTYLEHEYDLLNNGAYPNKPQLEFGYNNTTGASVQTRYKARRVYSMLLNNTITYCGLEDEADIADLVNSALDWRTDTTFTLIRDSRFTPGASGLSRTTNASTLTTTVTPTGDSPTEIQFGGKYVNIVDTLDVQISLKDGAPDYRFADKWSSFKSVEDAHLKIPLIRKTYHTAPYDSLICTVADDEYNYVFPPVVSEGTNTHTFVFGTDHRHGTNVLDVDNRVISSSGEADDHTGSMDFTDPSKTEIRLIEADGSTPDWCEITTVTDNTITVHCKGNGIRSPRSANILLAYAMKVHEKWRYINFCVQVAQSSRFQFEGNQHLVHSKGASGDDLKDGVQQVHENRTILYYYNPSNVEQSTDQRVELPIRERNFYGWWRWYSLQPGEEDTDIPAERWQTAPSNTGKWNFSFRTIGGKVPDPEGGEGDSIPVTQGRYTVFHVPSQDYGARKDPPSKAPMVYPPTNKDTVTYAVDLSVYYDNLPLSMKNVNQVDTAKLDTMQNIIEPTLSIREIFELHPWTEMAEIMEGYKDTIDGGRNDKYLEDHVVRAPLNNRLLLKTEHRYDYDNIKNGQHSESLLGYYMRDDNWASMSSDPDPVTGITRQDTMIWCGGWDAKCKWYTYNPKTKTYSSCSHKVTEANDFLSVSAKTSMPAGKEVDTVIYCLRAQSQKTLTAGTVGDPDTVPVPGDYWFNICRYTIIYHRQERFGPKLEEKIDGVDKAIITNTEIEEHFDVMQRLNFDYNKPGTEYTVYPHPLPWADASYGFAYPKTASLPDNRPHNKGGLENLANMGEYNLINRIPSFGTFWHKMEQHGGARNGYMIFCDGMSSAGQVAALHLDTTLCEGQKMYFSAFVGNPGNETGKTCPNFTFSVQGSENGRVWEDITTYMTGDLPQSNKWYQIYFPIEQNKQYSHFRVRVYNMAANDDGNDFIIDDMCIFATKPPLLVYQANTTCKNENESDSLTHIVLRVDYQGFTDDAYKADDEFYTIQEISRDNDTTFLRLVDGYDNQDIKPTTPSSRKDTVYGKINLPNRTYTPGDDNDSIFANLKNLVSLFETTLEAHEKNPEVEVFRKGYVFEHLDDSIRPVFYVIHSAKMSSHSTYIVHMAGAYNELLSSQCGLTRKLKVRNRMILTLNGDEQPEKEVAAMCSNSLYDVSLHVKGTLLLDNLAPVEVTGSCYNDWLLHGDTTIATSERTYGYKYEDIEKVIRDILRADGQYGGEDNANQFARALVEVDSAEMARVQVANGVALSDGDLKPYTILKHLVNEGLLTLYQTNVAVLTPVNDSVKYTIFPISGSGSEVLQDMNIDVCPTPVHIALKSSIGGGVPLIIGGLNRSEEESQYPIDVLADVEHVNSGFAIPIDSLMMQPGGGAPEVVLKQIHLMSTNDPEFREGVDNILLAPDRTWKLDETNVGYYTNGNDTLVVVPASESNYRMRGGYSYTFGIEMMTHVGDAGWQASGDSCPVGTIPFTVRVVPDYLRWDPQTSDNRWNNPDNWIGIDQNNTLIHEEARFAPLSTTHVLIPPMTDGKPYPVLPASISSADSIQQVGFQYNVCHSIRFLPGGALSQQQRLEYDSVIADLSTPHDKWALRATPLEGLLSGDLFMSNADLTLETPTWEVGEFDASGRNYSTGNASFWLSLFSRDAFHLNNPQQEDVQKIDTVKTAAATWSKVTNALTLPLQPAQGWAVFTRTASGSDADVRLPKKDDIYYYYTKSGDKVLDLYESGLRAKRATSAGGADKVGKMAFYPGKAATSKSYTLTNGTAASKFVFGNPTMGYIDIWGFIADNTLLLDEEIGYMNANGEYTTITKEGLGESNAITSLSRYLPPMHAIVLTKKGVAATELSVTLNTNRIVTNANQIVRPSAPKRAYASANKKGIMTVTAVNPVSPRCISRLLLGQGYDDAINRGEDAVLTTLNIDNFNLNTTPTTPFNIYAMEGTNGLSIDLRETIVNVPIAFYNSALPYDPVTYLWFTGVNAIDGELVLYDALTGTERPIMDGICLSIETPEVNHETRYFIRRPGYNPTEPVTDPPIATGTDPVTGNPSPATYKLIKNGHVLILREGHVYSVFGQKIR